MGKGKVRQFVASTINQLSVMVGGASYCWFEPITIRLEQDSELNLTAEKISWLIAIIEVGCVIGSLVSGYLADRVGRKYVIMSIGPLCSVGWIIFLFSRSMLSLIVVRILLGVTIGVAMTVTPIYTAEIVEPEWRGRLSGVFQVTLYLGALYVFSSGPYLSYNFFVYVSLLLAIIFTTIWMFMPETPYYLLMSEKEDGARKVLKYFRDGDIEEELRNMKNAIKEEMSTEGSWKTLFCDKVERKALIIVLIVSIAKFVGGMAVILNYALDTFSKSDSFLPAEDMSILLAILLSLIGVVSAFMSDWIGRRPLLLISCFGCFVTHILTGGYYYMHEKTTIDVSYYTWTLYVGLSMYCFFTDIGVGPLLATLQSEMFGANTRGVAGGFTGGFAAFSCLVIIKVYTPVNERYGIYINFWFYGLTNLVCGILLFWLFYETAGKTIGKMEAKSNNTVCV